MDLRFSPFHCRTDVIFTVYEFYKIQHHRYPKVDWSEELRDFISPGSDLLQGYGKHLLDGAYQITSCDGGRDWMRLASQCGRSWRQVFPNCYLPSECLIRDCRYLSVAMDSFPQRLA